MIWLISKLERMGGKGGGMVGQMDIMGIMDGDTCIWPIDVA